MNGLMSPMDAFAYFKATRETTYVMNNTVQLVAPADIHRVAIMFGAAGGGIQISTRPNVSASDGFPQNATFAPLPLTQRDFGNAVQGAWYAIAAIGPTLTVLEVFLQEKAQGEYTQQED